jgi:hypothetical protein
METINSLWLWFWQWETDVLISTWAKANVFITAFIIVGIRTIVNRTKTTIDNEFFSRLKERFGVEK